MTPFGLFIITYTTIQTLQAHPKYEYEYEIKDPHTHDFKQQHEHRDGDAVKGEYSLHQPDGTVRIVKYYADKKTG